MKIVVHDSEAMAKGQQVITACAFIHKKIDGVEKVFLSKRSETRKFLPGVFELPGGHIEFGEDIVKGLKREIHEELNMHVSIGDPFDVFTYSNPVKKSHSIQVTYFAVFTNSLDDIKVQEEEISDFGWFSEKEIAEKVICETKTAEDGEVKAIMKAFAVLRGIPLKHE